jgi:hypothetical protein
MISYEVGYVTGSGNHMTMTVHGHLMDRMDVPVVDNIDQVQEMCHYKKKCGGWNGGCPPYSPHFDRVKPKSSQFFVIAVEFDMAASITYSGWWKGVSPPGLYILTFADRITMYYTQRLLNYFEHMGYYTLGLSNCPGCRPKDCTVTQGGKCSKPKKRRYSVESTGIMCNFLHKEMFKEVQPWWFRTGEYMPTVMMRYAGVFVQDESEPDLVRSLCDAMMFDKSFVTETINLSGDFDVKKMKIPGGCYDAGELYYAYRIPIERLK